METLWKDVFLGGTCGGNRWRDRVIPSLEKAGIDYFNPQLPVGTPWGYEDKAREDFHKDNDVVQVYYLGNTMQYGIPEVSTYSVFELARAPNNGLIAVVAMEEWLNEHILSAMTKISKDLRNDNVQVLNNTEELVAALIKFFR